MAVIIENSQVIPETETKFRVSYFPNVQSGKIEVHKFLEASKEVVLLVDELGTIFKPLSYDMSNNINKIAIANDKYKCWALEDLLLEEKKAAEGIAADALLWLKRSLHFYFIFFNRMINDESERQCLEEFMVGAYQVSLEPHHGWVTRKMFTIFKKAIPPRSTIITILKKKMTQDADVMKELNTFCVALGENVDHISAIYDSSSLNASSVVP